MTQKSKLLLAPALMARSSESAKLFFLVPSLSYVEHTGQIDSIRSGCGRYRVVEPDEQGLYQGTLRALLEVPSYGPPHRLSTRSLLRLLFLE